MCVSVTDCRCSAATTRSVLHLGHRRLISEDDGVAHRHDACKVANRLFGGVALVVPVDPASEDDCAVLHAGAQAPGNEDVPAERVSNGDRDVRIFADMLAQELDREIMHDRADPVHAPGDILGGPRFTEGVDAAAERDRIPRRRSPQSGRR